MVRSSRYTGVWSVHLVLAVGSGSIVDVLVRARLVHTVAVLGTVVQLVGSGMQVLAAVQRMQVASNLLKELAARRSTSAKAQPEQSITNLHGAARTRNERSEWRSTD